MSYAGCSASYLARLTAALALMDHSALDRGIAMIAEAWQRGSQIITLGNGGSAMTALHFVTDWGKMIPLSSGKPLNARSLVDNMGLITAYANDLSYADVFWKQLEYIMKPGDLVVAISGSGNSENVIRAIDYANEAGGITLGLCGFSGGRLKDKASHAIWVDSQDMQICEDAHMIFGHIAMQTLCRAAQDSSDASLVPSLDVAPMLRKVTA